jgi:hypothetical protein
MSKTIKKSHFVENLLVFTVFSAYFTPGVPLTSSFDVRIDDAIVFGILPLLFFYKPRLYRNPIVLSLLVIIGVTSVSTIYGYLFLEVPASLRDFNEIVRYTKPLILALLITRCDSRYIIGLLRQLMPILSFCLIALGIIQYFDFGGLGAMTGFLFATPGHVNAMIGNSSRRIVLTTSDPNVAAYMALLFFLYNFISVTINKKKSSFVLTALLLIIIMMTSSRTGFLALISVLGIFLLSSKSFKFFHKFGFVLFYAVVIYLLYDKFQYIVVGLSTALDGENTSLLYRVEKWQVAWDIFLLSPAVGWGPAKGMMTTIVDGEFILFLRRYGVVGIVTICFSIFYMPFWGRRLKVQDPTEVKVWEVVLKYYLIVIFFVMVTNSFFSGYQLFLPYVFITTVIYKYKKKRSFNQRFSEPLISIG